MNAEEVLYGITGFLTDPNVLSNTVTVLAVCLGCFILGSLLRLLFGRNCTAVKAVTVVFGIFILYLTVFALKYAEIPFESYLPSLPFAQFGSNYISISPIMDIDKDQLCTGLVNLIVLVAIMGLLDDLVPRGKNLFVWLLLRIVTITVAAVVYTLITRLLDALLPGVILEYAPLILLLLLAVFLAVTLFKWLFGVVLGLSCGAVVGAIYAFFISHILGKQLTKAAFSSGILMGFAYLASYFQVNHIILTDPIGLFVGLAIILLLLMWYLVNKLF